MFERVRHFKSKKSYKKWIDYLKMHNIKIRRPTRIYINNKFHRVIHNKKRKGN